MEHLKFNSLDEAVKYFNSFLNNEITIINRISDHNFEFLIENNWYKLSFEKEIGTSFHMGHVLLFRESSDRKNWNYLYRSQTQDKEPNSIFNKLNSLYVKYLFINKENIVGVLDDISVIMSGIDYIEKFKEEIFILTFGEKKISISFVSIHDCIHFNKTVKIHIYDKVKCKKPIIEVNYYDDLYNFLCACYSIKHIRNSRKIRNLLLS